MQSDKSIDGERILTLNVGGVKFQARASLFTRHPSTLLGAMLLCDTADRHKSEFFFDANPRAFESVMDMYRRGTLKCPKDMDIEVFQAELDYWQIPSCDSVSNLLEVDKSLFHEATVANTKRYEKRLLAESGAAEEGPASKRARYSHRGRGNESDRRTGSDSEEDETKDSEEVSRVINVVDSLCVDLEEQISRLQGNRRILSSVRRALDSFSAGLYEYKDGEDWRLLQSIAEQHAKKSSMRDGHSMDEILTCVEKIPVEVRSRSDEGILGSGPLGGWELEGEDRVLFKWWEKTVGQENLELFWMPFFVRPDRKRVYVDSTFGFHLKSRAELFKMLDIKGETDEEDNKKPESFKIGRMDVDFDTITRHGIQSCFAVDQEDWQNGGYFTLVRYDVPMLRISWDPSNGPKLEERIQAVLRGESDPSPYVSVLQSARCKWRKVEVAKPRDRREIAAGVPDGDEASSDSSSDSD